MSTRQGRFISLEGVEGVGKTSNRQVIEKTLQAAGIDYIVTREPGGTVFGEQLRDLVLNSDTQVEPEAELLLMVASRLTLVTQRIQPALEHGQWVLCDRYMDASVAYQGAGRRLGVQRVLDLHALMGVTLLPDLTLLLDLPAELGLARVTARSQPDRIESEAVTFFERARHAYLERAAADPTRFCVIDASNTLDQVSADVARAVEELIQQTV